MRTRHPQQGQKAPGSIAHQIRERIVSGRDGYLRMQDFNGLPATAVSQALSRLARQGILQRVGKGLYYHARPTPFGPSRPSESAISQLPIARKRAFPAGISAANLLGFTTQNPARPEVATAAGSLPRTIIGAKARVHTRRPEAWNRLSVEDAALLDFIRQRGSASELPAQETVRHLLGHFGEPGRYRRLMETALSEPPRVRAMLGAIGQELSEDPSLLAALHESLNPLSRFDFGLLSELPHASEWQAKTSGKRGRR